MHRAILIAWFPWFLSLVAAGVGVWCVLRFGGARLELAKLRRLHRCEGGGVQSLSFVLTLPLFILLLMFIVQVTELMVGIVVVHYAAFAAARAAIVWLPAEVPPYEPANVLEPGVLDWNMLGYPQWVMKDQVLDAAPPDQLWKYRKIWVTAVLGCTPIAPSRDLATSSRSSYVSQTLQALYPTLVPSASQYPAIGQLIQKKFDYSTRNTMIIVTGIDRSGTRGPTYNAFPGYMGFTKGTWFWESDGQVVGVPITRDLVPEWIPWNPNEVGWEDPITVKVLHRFALLPGPGRFLAAVLHPSDGTPDLVSSRIKSSSKEQYRFPDSQGKPQTYRLYTVTLEARVALSNEGLKSVLPYAQAKD